MSRVQRWILCFLIAVPGAVLYRAADSEWFEVGSYKFLLTFVGLTMATVGILLFIFLLNFAKKEDKS